MKNEREIMIAGAAILDVLVRPADRSVFDRGSYGAEEICMSFGGDAFNEASVLAKLGEQVELLTVVGRDRAGELVLDRCRELGISTEHILCSPEVTTGINVVLVQEDGSRNFLTNANGSLRSLEMNHFRFPFPREIGILCFASIFVFPLLRNREMSEIFRRAKEQGILLCADMTKCKNGETVEDMRETLAYLDYVFPNKEEAEMVTGETEVEDMAQAFLDCGVKNVVIKCGAQGCFLKNTVISRQIKPTVTVRCVDTTGAGDSFVAGFLYGLSQGKSLEECAGLGNACGGLAVQTVGATDGIRSLEQVLRNI